ncbi:dipeptide/oligopeptide/nickel ABC transporter ATP-binding protein [Nocardiopsis terrae]|uniref:Peptide/nickel transport system permease protein n=1 Tax=Nocardiopsis terrae TaxID=372655 RepID=A0ABR9HDD7_9ACTN|nr:dipeptide/oligopeptide/nickel ABC transporter permease/ATP-binding protein [Nocardiopsis terrae]MBE1456810.1 peptide/nickel transport system permease protein [Nocardiopsis terrae]GHC75004.1 dipeptide/oligopeptide/nickel ABC transporter ATP-binding protein [Nocardiopsis terrae]
MSSPVTPDAPGRAATQPEHRPEAAGPPGPGRRSATVRRFLTSPQALGSSLVLAAVVTLVVFAPLFTAHAPTTADLEDAFGPPGGGHLLGFDSSGRDVWSRLLYGGRNTLGGALLAVAVALAVGVPSGLAAGYYGGWFDSLSNWWVNLVMALPAMVVLLATRAVLGTDVWVLMIVLGVLVAPAFYRLVRGAVAAMRGELYVDAARVFGLRDSRIIARHVLVVVRAPVIIQGALVAGMAIGLQAGLEFLGIGSGDLPTWGAMLNEAFTNIQRAPLFMLWPGLALGLTSATLVLLAASLRDVLEDRGTAPATGRGARRGGADAPTTLDSAGERADLLSVRDLAVTYTLADGSSREVVHGVDLDVRRGEVLGLVGESGSGKTQTAFSVLGLLPEGGRVSRGSVLLDGTEVVGSTDRALRNLRGDTVAYVPQEPMSNLDPAFTIGDHLTEPLRVKLGLSRAQARERALDLLRQVEIPDPERTFRSHPHQISGGMAQRVLIAGAVSCDPDLLVADEPTTALDVTVQAEVLALLRRLQAERGMGVLLVTHNLGVVADLCDRVAVMRDGRIVETGTTERILSDPREDYTRGLLDAVLDDTPARAPWQPREAAQ